MSVATKNKINNNSVNANVSDLDLLNRMRLFYSGFETMKEYSEDVRQATLFLKSPEGQAKLKRAEAGPFLPYEEMMSNLYKKFGLANPYAQNS